MATIDRIRRGGTAVPGLRLRPYAGEADIPDMVRIYNAEAEADRLSPRTTVEELTSHLSNPSASFDPARDVTIADLRVW